MLDVLTGEWMGKVSGLGAGVDSYYEILLKSFVMFGEPQDAEMFHVSYEAIKQHMRRGRAECNSGSGLHPLYVNVEMGTGNTATNWIDSLQAAFPPGRRLCVIAFVCAGIIAFPVPRWDKPPPSLTSSVVLLNSESTPSSL